MGRSLDRVFVISAIFIITPAYATYPDCPVGSGPAVLSAWRNQALDAEFPQGPAFITTMSAAEAIKTCFPNYVPPCLRRLAAYSETGPRAPYTSLFPNEQKKLPGIFKGFGNGADAFQIPPNIEKIIAGSDAAPDSDENVNYKQWKVVKYKSRSTGGFDAGPVSPSSRSTESLMLIFVPGTSFSPPLKYDQWINIGLPSDQGKDRFKPAPQRSLPQWKDYSTHDAVLPQTMTMLTMQKASEGQKAKILFQNFDRMKKSPLYKYSGAPLNANSCTGCHATGMRAISPLGYFAPGVSPPSLDTGNQWMNPEGISGSAVPRLPADTQAAITQLNEVMTSYGVVDWGTARDPDGKKRTFYDPYAHGVGLGSITPAKPRTDEFMNGCMKLKTEVSYQSIRGVITRVSMGTQQPNLNRVRDAMNCAMCHGTSRAPINVVFKRTEVEFKVLIDHSMPMVGGEGMTHADRIALVNCLYAELPANDLAWYKDMSCESSVSRGFLEPNGACSGDGSTSPLRQAGELDNILRGLLNGFSRNPTQI